MTTVSSTNAVKPNRLIQTGEPHKEGKEKEIVVIFVLFGR